MTRKQTIVLCVLIIVAAGLAVAFLTGVLPPENGKKTAVKTAKSQSAQNKTPQQSSSESQTDTALTQTIQGQDLNGPLAKNQKWSVYAEELSGDKKTVDIDGERQMQSASTIKLFIAAAVYSRGLQDGERSLVQKMLTVSDNDAANTLVSHLGGGSSDKGLAAVNAWCAKNGYAQTSMGRLFLEAHPKADNFTSAKDLSHLLNTIYNGSCVSAQASSEILGFLTAQTRTDKIPAGVRESGKTKTVANKTGEIALGQGTGCIENDAALVYDGQNAYTLVVLSNDLNGDNDSAQATIRDIAKTVAQTWP